MDLLSYVASVGPSEDVPGARHNLEAEQMMFAMSKYAKQGTTPDEMMRKLFPQVMQGEAKMMQNLEAEGPLSDPRREEVRLAMIELNKLPFWDPKYEELRRRVVKMQARNRKLGLFGTVALPQPSPSRGDVAAPVDNPPAANPPLAADPPFPSDHTLASGRYRFTECCILPDHEYDVTGTCGENPEAKDTNDRNLIRKGTNEPTFLISGLAQPQVNTMLRLRAYFMIFGGAMLAVFCLALLLLTELGQF